ncbi:uncharacterized protein PHACADRAFT_259015 [Phanerochaete carnosa HHB-10118-sp]|uniref:F-box domain-containing protein n=1 Tax=Phanerochaete carnosa (strain HHB-10118-sp) TaxID=650164 RepID=K5W6V2_PHACS|nr:uncharacterized protein PHACADRAFT_259015 [Phanerochaete carnosa HHB-10118-sp]EKM54860.1 hypothetical protein PHACADRAFT_259015 [Phanerochaete carnosa HHB-10118-sp]
MLKTCWNTTLPVSRLPPELLLLVFEDWASECYTETQETEPETRPYAWIRCTHVCRRWRELALSSPFLWRRIVPTSPEWTQELLSRSRQTPLLVNFNSSDFKSAWNISRVRQEGTHHLLRHQFHRFREVHMDAFDLDNPTGVTAPLLTSLRIMGFYENPVASYLFRNTTADQMPDDSWVFARDGLPALRRLDVFVATQPIIWSCFRTTLQTLRTRFIRPRPSAAAWLAALREMPSLRDLDIDLGDMLAGAHTPEWNPLGPVSGPVILPALTGLAITDECDGRSSAELLSGLVLPIVDHIDVDLLSARYEMESPAYLVSLLNAIKPLCRGCRLDNLQLDVREDLNAVMIKLEPLFIMPDHTFPPSLQSTWGEGLPYIRLCIYSDLTRSTLREYLRAMQDVRVLRVGGDPAQDESRRAPIFPHLNTLRLLGLSWVPRDDDEDSRSDSDEEDDDAPFKRDAESLMKQTAKVMQSRKKAGCEIAYIVLAEKLSATPNK